ncbi:hypothetical protein CHUAL_006847 [Chamberlinius hualienensis]
MEEQNLEQSIDQMSRSLDDTESLHNFIINGDIDNVKQFLSQSGANLSGESDFYLNLNGESAAFVALQRKQFEIYAVFMSKGIRCKDATERYIITELTVEEKSQLKQLLLPNFPDINNAVIWFLLSKTRTANNRGNCRMRDIERYYTELNKIPEISVIFSVIKCRDRLDIIFDFSQDSVIDVDPTQSESVSGVSYYLEGRIYIGAADNDDRFIMGTIAHELTHYAMQIVFSNSTKPYLKVDEIRERQFSEIIDEIKTAYDDAIDMDRIIERTFECYSVSQWPCELIVRVNHMLAHYYNVDNYEKLRKQVPQLLEYYRNQVIPCCDAYVNESYFYKPRNDILLLNSSYNISPEQSNVKFQQHLDLHSSISKINNSILLVSTCSTMLSSIKVCQSLSHLNIPNDRFLILNFEIYCKQSVEVLELLYTDACMLSVIVNDSVLCPDETSWNGFFTNVTQLMQQKPSMKIILVIRQIDQSFFEKLIKTHFQFEVVEDGNLSFSDLSEETQNYLLNKKISLQGKYVLFNKFVSNNNFDTISVDIIEKLTSNELIRVGNDVALSAGYDKNIYVERDFKCFGKFDLEMLKSDTEEDIIAISNITLQRLKQLTNCHNQIRRFDERNLFENDKFIILDEIKAFDQFDELITDVYTRKLNVHWFILTDDDLVWQMSKGKLLNIRKFVKVEIINESKLCSLVSNQKVVIITDIAGGGKSTALSHLALFIKETYDDIWVVKIDLNDFTSTFERKMNAKSQFSPREALRFIYDSQFVTRRHSDQSKFEENFFRSNADKVVALFDGFDEINPDYTEIVKTLLHATIKAGINQIWLTTRPYCKTTLEDEFQCFSYHIMPFNETNQIEFFTKYMTSKLRWANTEVYTLNSYAVDFRNQIKKNLPRKLLTGNPLQIQMMAEIFLDNCNAASRSPNWSNLIDKDMKLSDLYKQLFRKKFNIYQKNKLKVDYTVIGNKSAFQKNFRKFLETHQVAALSVFFNSKEAQLLKEFVFGNGKEFIFNHIEVYGVVTHFTDSKPQFVHLTYVEYLIATVVKSVLLNHLKSHISDILLLNVLSKESFQMIRAFLNEIIEPEAIPLKTLKHIKKRFKYLWKTDGIKKSETILYTAVNENNCAIVRLLGQCLKGSKLLLPLVTAAPNFKLPVLHLAAKSGNAKMVDILVNDFKVNVNSVDDSGYTPLHISVINNNLDVVKILIKKYNANLHAINNNGCTPLHEAAISNSPKMVHFLLNNCSSNMLLQFNNATSSNQETLNKHKEIVKLIIQNYIGYATATDGDTPLHMAVIRNNIKLIKILIDNYDADVDSSNNDGRTPLHEAVINNNIAIVTMLIEDFQANVDAVDINGNTPLHWSVMINSLEMFTLLSHRFNANVYTVDNERCTLLHLAAARCDKEISRENSILDNEQIIRKLVTNFHLDVDAKNSDGCTPLHLAAGGNNKEVVKMLIREYNAHVNVVDKDGQTPLHLAAFANNTEIVDMLVDGFNADIKIKDVNGHTPLNYINQMNRINTGKLSDKSSCNLQ